MRKSLLILTLIFLPFLAACSSYHPLKDGVGFTDLPIGTDDFRITYAGDSNMPVAEARRFALLRASELAALRSAPYFQIVDEHILLAYGQNYYPGTDTRYVETFSDRSGRTHAILHHSYDPGYTERFMIPEVSLQVHFLNDPTHNSVPTAYLLRQAQAEKIPLSPTVADHLAQLPDPGTTVTIPPPPTPTTAPAPAP